MTRSKNSVVIIGPIPCVIKQSARRLFWLNLNNYRNLHGLTLGRLKVTFKDTIQERLGWIQPVPFPPPYTFVYTVFLKKRGKVESDVMNVGAVLDKFMADVLVDMGAIPNDDRTVIPDFSFRFGGKVKGEPFAFLHIVPYVEMDTHADVRIKQINA